MRAQKAFQVLNFAMIVSSALMIWKGLMVVTGSESPIVVVLSGSMEPAFHRGDLLFLTNDQADPIRVGEVVVFKIDGRDIPIVHRVLKVHERYAARGPGSALAERPPVCGWGGSCRDGRGWASNALRSGTTASPSS
jgi:signal peptidase I